MPEFIAKLDLEAAALLIESHASDAQTLHAQCEQVMSALQRYHIIESVPFTSESKTVATLWGIRKGMFLRWEPCAKWVLRSSLKMWPFR